MKREHFLGAHTRYCDVQAKQLLLYFKTAKKASELDYDVYVIRYTNATLVSLPPNPPTPKGKGKGNIPVVLGFGDVVHGQRPGQGRAEAEAGQLSRLLPAPTAAANRKSLTQ